MTICIRRFADIDGKDFLVFIIGLFSMIKVRILGTFGLSEIFIFVLYFFVANPFIWLKHRGVTNLFLMACLWLLGVFISDRYNGTSMEDSLKGFFNVFFLIGLIPFVYWALHDNPRRMLCFWIGNAISSLFAFYIQKSVDLNEFEFDVWRVYAWHYPFMIFSGVLFYKGKTLLACMLVEGFAIWSLFHMSRNVFLTITLSVCVILFIKYIAKENLQEHIEAFKRKLIGLFLVLSIAGIGIGLAYEYLASNRILGERAYAKYYMQKHSKLGLVSGRGDFFQSVYLVSKNPIFGYGSYARNTDGALDDYYISNGISYNRVELHDNMLPGHSYLMGSWLFAGILGALFWIYIIFLIGKFFRGALLYDKELIGINVLLTFAVLWNILFSPFANRLNFLFYIIMIILTLNQQSQYVRSSNENINSNSFV